MSFKVSVHKILQSSQENTCVGVSFETFEKNFFYRTPLVAASTIGSLYLSKSIPSVKQIKNSTGILPCSLRIQLYCSASSFVMLSFIFRSFSCYCFKYLLSYNSYKSLEHLTHFLVLSTKF